MRLKVGSLFHYLDQAFESTGGVSEILKTDNMKTVMDEARTEYSNGKINAKFQQLVDDYGFKVRLFSKHDTNETFFVFVS
ncbi:MAG: hypothetical protein J6K75_10010, partial [Erysipelotrichaceae bacterium]|nr:hypothetical protein [Erysipelotrichaceae bacterium]